MDAIANFFGFLECCQEEDHSTVPGQRHIGIITNNRNIARTLDIEKKMELLIKRGGGKDETGEGDPSPKRKELVSFECITACDSAHPCEFTRSGIVPPPQAMGLLMPDDFCCLST